MLLSLIHTLQSLLSLPLGYYSYTSITKVQTYEDATKKAAKYSNTAENQLQSTQSTQAAGAISILASTSSSLYLLLSTTTRPAIGALISIALTVGLATAHSHISNFWRMKRKVPLPGSGDYNDAISTTNMMRQLLGGLGVSWALVGVVYLWKCLF